MATKSSRKRTDFDKKSLVQKLNQLAENVSKRGIFVVVKENNYYHIVEAFDKKITLHTIYSKILADKLCASLNSLRKEKNKLNFNKAQKILLKHTDYMLECEVYKHIIKSSPDEDRRQVAQVRLSEVMIKARYEIRGLPVNF